MASPASSSRRTLRSAFFAAWIALVVGVGWIASRDDGEAREALGPRETEPADAAALALDSRSNTPGSEHADASTASASAPGEREAVASPQPVSIVTAVDLYLRDADNGHGIENAVVRMERGERSVLGEHRGANVFRCANVTHEPWNLRVEAPGYRILETYVVTPVVEHDTPWQIVQLQPFGVCEANVVTTEGRNLFAFARALGVDANELFSAESFTAQRLVGGPGGRKLALQAPSGASDEATFAVRQRQRTDGVSQVGTLRLNTLDSAWIELHWRGMVVDQQLIERDTEQATFALDPRLVREQLGSVAFQVVDRETGSPLPEASVRIHRKRTTPAEAPTRPVPLAPDGRGKLTALLDGEYEFAIDADGRRSFARTLHIETGAALDLGAIELDRAAPLIVHVRRSDGEPALALVQVAPYEPNMRADVAFAQREATFSGADGVATLGRPASKVILRAVATTNQPNSYPPADSDAVLRVVDPEQLTGAVELVLAPVARVEVQADDGARRVAQNVVEDANTVRVAVGLGARLTTWLPPGAYRAFALDAEGQELADDEFVVEPNGEPVRIRLH